MTMRQFAYALAGEGRGHATRARTVAQRLAERGHRVCFITGGDAEAFLRDWVGDDPRFGLIRVPVLRFAYRGDDGKGRVSLAGTAANALRYWRRLGGLVREVDEELRHGNWAPEVVLSDYEPLGYRLARRRRVPTVCIDSQHFFACARLQRLPISVWSFVLGIRMSCRLFCPHPTAVYIAKPVSPDDVRLPASVFCPGPLLRPEIAEHLAEASSGDFFLAYLRPSISGTVLPLLREAGVSVRVYGLGEAASEGRIEFRPISAAAFADDLLACRGIIATAGNQLIAEALSAHKPLLLFPEPGQVEQLVNAIISQRFNAVLADHDIAAAPAFRTFVSDPSPTEFPFPTDAADHIADALEKLG